VYIMVTVNTGVKLVLERSLRTACHAPDSCCEEGRRQLLRKLPTLSEIFLAVEAVVCLDIDFIWFLCPLSLLAPTTLHIFSTLHIHACVHPLFVFFNTGKFLMTWKLIWVVGYNNSDFFEKIAFVLKVCKKG
jgi:hypothetical protein